MSLKQLRPDGPIFISVEMMRSFSGKEYLLLLKVWVSSSFGKCFQRANTYGTLGIKLFTKYLSKFFR